MKKNIERKLFFILLALSLISVACVFPYVLTVQSDAIQKIGKPLGFLLFAQLIQSVILFSVTIFFGLFFAKKIGFHFLFIEAILKKEDYKKVFGSILGKSVLAGIAVAIAIFFLDPLFTAQGASVSTHQNLAPAWQKLLAAFYGGISEEILMRLFLMTFFIWIGMKVVRKSQPTRTGIWVSIILAAIIFGLGHLPITASVTRIDSLVVARAIILNGIAGVVFGWLFWKKGFESAVIAHFTADIFLLTLLPLIFE